MKLIQNTIKGGSNKKNKRIKLNKKNKRTKPMLILDWIDYVEKNGMCLKMSDIKKLKTNESIKIAVALIQQTANSEDNWKDGQVIRPEDFFSCEIFIYPNILNGTKYGKSQFHPEYDPSAIEPFYDDKSKYNYAVVSSEGDTSILWSKLKELPGIIYQY